MNTREQKREQTQEQTQEQKFDNQRTIFDYVTDNSMYINKSQCFNSTPPFVSYTPIGVPNKNIDIENDLRGSTRYITKSTENKYYPEDLKTVQSMSNTNIYNLNECNKDIKILNGYINQNNN